MPGCPCRSISFCTARAAKRMGFSPPCATTQSSSGQPSSAARPGSVYAGCRILTVMICTPKGMGIQLLGGRGTGAGIPTRHLYWPAFLCITCCTTRASSTSPSGPRQTSSTTRCPFTSPRTLTPSARRSWTQNCASSRRCTRSCICTRSSQTSTPTTPTTEIPETHSWETCCTLRSAWPTRTGWCWCCRGCSTRSSGSSQSR
mmetsp:Transcript_31903/g.70287  ORF Transcript_31903/g.70287 Transcript_31903/m.70287 type:complete len:202 (-) Transcript_31903:1779-2384(-)